MKEIWLYRTYSDENDVEAVSKVIRRGTWWIKGKEIKEFEEMLANYVGTRYALSFNSGSSALFANLLAIDVKGGEVILPSLTFIATADSVVNAGAKPVFADIERKTFGLSAEDVNERITSKTKAIIVMHFGGNVAIETKALKEIADDNKIPLIEDAAHALGALFHGEKAGTFGYSAMFSFSFNKIISTGEGGAIVTDSEKCYEKLSLLRSHGQKGKDVIVAGFNLRMSSITAALGVSQMKKVDMLIERRRKIASKYNDMLRNLPVKCPYEPPNSKCVYQRYSILLESKEERDALQKFLKEKNIPSTISYPPIHLFSFFREKYGYKEGDLPTTEEISKRILTLPFHPELTEEEIDYIVGNIKEFFEG